MNPQFTEIQNLSIRNNDIDIIRENSFQQFPKLSILFTTELLKFMKMGLKTCFAFKLSISQTIALKKLKTKPSRTFPNLRCLISLLMIIYNRLHTVTNQDQKSSLLVIANRTRVDGLQI